MELMLNPNTKKKENPKLSVNHKRMEQAANNKVEVGRTSLHGCHPSRAPL
jgi:hypothetical protein